MEVEDEIIVEDDAEILDIINFGFPRRRNERSRHFDEMDDFSFYRRFLLTKNTTLTVLAQIEDNLEFDNDLNNSISPMNQLLTALRFYACGGHQNSIGDFMGTHQTSVSRIVRKVSLALVELLPQHIQMPRNNEILKVQTDFFNISRFPRVIGCMDGTHIKILSPGGEDAEIFRNRKSYFSVNVQVVCDSHLKIRDIVARWPGSTHDLTIFNHSRLRARIEGGEFPNSVLLGDSGYINRPYLMIPLANPQTRAERLYNESQIRTRNVVERQIGVWKRRFLCLLYGLRCDLDTSLMVIVATAILNNIAIDMNEGPPPPPENIDEHQLHYLIEMGNIPQVPDVNEGPVIYNHREQLVNTYFGNL